jgi:hypothetical protein
MSARIRLLLILTSSALLVAAAPAMAKGIAGASVCGADGCTMVAHAKSASASCPTCSAEELLSIQGTAYPRTRAPYVRLVLTLGAGGRSVGTERLLYAPALKLVARRSDLTGEWTWYRPPAAAIEIVTRMIGAIRPYPAAGMPLGVAAPTAVRASPQNNGAADPAGSTLLAGGAVVAIALLSGVALAARRRRSGRRALGAT